MKKSLGPNTLVYPTPVWVIGTYDQNGKANVMTAAWGGICCSAPPCIAVSLREATYTHGRIIARQAFTVNVGVEKYAAEVDYFGLSSGRSVDKFAATGLTAVKSEVVDAPYIAEFQLVLECKLKQIVEIGLHTQFIGEIIDVKADEEILGENDIPDIALLRPMIFSPGSRRYHGVGQQIGEAFNLGKRLRKKE
ncbi:MAG: flavin reductase family protein [Proteobacteria bacterium]|nr:flavin reductase family protein [Pseudomonadota bacterium]MBU0966609.1 flavin reductase family protein [Pseudomonadota bacterium]